MISPFPPLIPLEGSGPALMTAERCLSHDELAEAAADLARSWGPDRRLVFIELGRDIDSVVCYLAALNHGHVALVVPPERHEQRDALIAVYDPDVVCLVSQAVDVRRQGSVHDLHPDLALLLSTSGSTGSPKMVRLSRTNVVSNAAAIADYQGLRADDRAVSSVPLHYCFGLSVLHSHLLAGGGVVLTDLSVVDSCFWALAAERRVTTVSGVPHTFDLLGRTAEPHLALVTLRRLAQAGGRLAPDRVRALATQAHAAGFDFFVMYGQTEATARMAYLPPDRALTHPDAVGIAIPGGEFSVRPAPESDDPEIGELVFEGPGVMMGYAQAPADLALPAGPRVLHTGDLARVRDGLVHIVGRRSRHAKLFGLRVDLDHLEATLESAAAATRCVATERALHVFTSATGGLADVRRSAARHCHLPHVAVEVHAVDDIPRTASGKVDYAALSLRAARRERELDLADHDESGSTLQQVREAFALVLGRDEVSAEETFGSLGGDSLSYVELATRLEQILPTPLPADWHRLSLAGLASMPPADPRPQARPQRARSRLDSATALRALAMVLIVASHADVIAVLGGAHLLLALAGYNVARFQLADPDRVTRWRNLAATWVGIAVPCALWIAAVAALHGRYGWSTAVFVHQVVGSDDWSHDWEFWFIDALLLALLMTATLVGSTSLNHWETRRPWLFALLMFAAFLGVRVAWVGWSAGPIERYLAPVVLMFFALGWLVARSPDGVRRWVASAAVVAATWGFFGDAQRELVIITGLLFVLWCPSIVLPRLLARPVTVVATASLGIYLTHWLVYPPLEAAGLGLVAVLASVAVGVAFTRLTDPLRRLLVRATRRALYSTGRPSPRAMSMRWTSEVPSPISNTLASR